MTVLSKLSPVSKGEDFSVSHCEQQQSSGMERRSVQIVTCIQLSLFSATVDSCQQCSNDFLIGVVLLFIMHISSIAHD